MHLCEKHALSFDNASDWEFLIDNVDFQFPGTPSPKPHTHKPHTAHPQTPNPKNQTPNFRPQTSNPQFETLNPKPFNPKPHTPNRKPQTANPHTLKQWRASTRRSRTRRASSRPSSRISARSNSGSKVFPVVVEGFRVRILRHIFRTPLQTLPAASERRGDNLNSVQDLYLKAKARIWS